MSIFLITIEYYEIECIKLGILSPAIATEVEC